MVHFAPFLSLPLSRYQTYTTMQRPLRSGTATCICSVFLLVGMILTSGCNSVLSLQSQTPARDIAIDGRIEDWRGAINPVEGKNYSLGVLNDGEYLYVSLLTSDPDVTERIIQRGMTLWLDPDGGKDKIFGIRFPLGMGEPRRRPRDQRVRQERFTASLSELEILREDGKHRRLSATNMPGLTASAHLNYGMLQYELKVPLQHSRMHSYAVDAAPGTAISLGLETPTEGDDETQRQQPRQGRGGMGQGGMGGRSGRRGSGGMRGGETMGQQDPVELWAKVMLAPS